MTCPSSSTPATMTTTTLSVLGTVTAQGEETTRSTTDFTPLVSYTMDLRNVLPPCVTISDDSNGSADGIPSGSTCRVYSQEQQQVLQTAGRHRLLPIQTETANLRMEVVKSEADSPVLDDSPLPREPARHETPEDEDSPKG